MKNNGEIITEDRAGFPGWVIYLTLSISAIPFLLNLLGVDFRVPPDSIDISSEWTTHALLEWSSFGLAVFAAILAFIHYSMKGDRVSPVIAITLLLMGCSDAFQALSVDYLAEWIADVHTYMPFTWAVSRTLSALILIAGVGFLLLTRDQNHTKALPAVIITSVVLAFLAYCAIYISTVTHSIPQTLFPESFITRPWELGLLVVYMVAGAFLFPRFHKEERNYVSHSLMISVIPHMAAQLYMGFGSQILFDPYFKAAHFTKILAYCLPLSGLAMEIFKKYQHERQIVESFGMVQKELRKLDGHNKMVLDTVGDGVISLDSEGTTTSINPSAQLILGYTEEEFIGKSIQELIFPPNPEGEDLIEASIKYGKVYRETDHKFRRKNGSTFSVEYMITPILEEGQTIGAVITFRESTERALIEGYFYKALQEVSKAREEADRQKESAESANKSKTIFLSVMSHEIRTPLSVILGYAQMLQKDHSLDMDHRDAVGKIEASGNHLSELINDILDITKIEAGEMVLNLSDFDLHDLVNGLGLMFRNRCEEKDLEFSLEGVGEKPIYVHGDEGKLRQILVNLLGNAVKFTNQGKVTLIMEKKPDNGYTFSVVDTGNGISPEDHDKIFEPFKQGKDGLNMGGTGLGLPISWELAELMGGKISVESEEGKGSSFSLALELEPAKSPVPSRSGRNRQVKKLAGKVVLKALVVDDAQENRVMLCKVLKSIGIKIMEAENGEKAVETLKEFEPDIIFMDKHMPVMDGEEATKKIFKEYGPERFKIVGVTASALSHEQEVMLAAGCSIVIGKPFRVNQIFKCIQDLLDVEYEYKDDTEDRKKSPKKTPPESNEFSGMNIPAKMFLKFKDSIDKGDSSELEKQLASLGALGDQGKLLETRLSALVKEGDFEGILDLLEKIPVVGVMHD